MNEGAAFERIRCAAAIAKFFAPRAGARSFSATRAHLEREVGGAQPRVEPRALGAGVVARPGFLPRGSLLVEQGRAVVGRFAFSWGEAWARSFSKDERRFPIIM